MMVTDPVCGLELVAEDAADYSIFGGQVHYFCSDDCKERYDKGVERFFHKLGLRNGEDSYRTI